MTKANVTAVVNNVKATLTKHSPEILTGIGIAGWFTTTILVAKATPKALQKLDDAEYEKGEDLTIPEKVKVTWKYYAPAVALGATSTACLIGASRQNLKRNAALATAYKLTETAFAEYKEKVVETLGEKKEKAVRQKVVQEKLEKHPVDNTKVIVTGKGDVLCYDAVFGQYFESNMESIKKAVNEVNYQMLANQYASLNDLYAELGIPRIEVGDMVGWNISKDGMVEIDVDTQLSSDGRPCITIHYLVAPTYEYDRSH